MVEHFPQTFASEEKNTTKSAGGRLHLNELTHSLSGNTRPQSSQLSQPLWTDPGVESGISVRELMSTNKTNKKRISAGRE